MYNNNNRRQGNGGRGNGHGAKLEYVYTKSTFREQVPDQQSGGVSDRLILYLDHGQARQLADLIYQMDQTSRDGIRLTAYTGDKVNQETQEVFESTAISVQPFNKQNNGGGNGGGNGNRRQGRTGGFQGQGRRSAPAPGNGNHGEQNQEPQYIGNNNQNAQAEDYNNHFDHPTTDFVPEPSFNQSDDIPF